MYSILLLFIFLFIEHIIEESFAGHNQQRVLCVGMVNGVISVWSVPQPRLLHTMQGHMYSPVTSLSIDKDGMLLASGNLCQSFILVLPFSLY